MPSRKHSLLNDLLENLLDDVYDAAYDAIEDAISPLIPHLDHSTSPPRQKRARTNRPAGGAQPSSKGPGGAGKAGNRGGKGQRRGKPEPAYYDVLGVDYWAPEELIRKAWRDLVLKWHPDKFRGSKEKAMAERKTARINEAYTVLKDQQKRAQYNARLRAEERL